MGKDRQTTDRGERVRNAVSGYAVIILGIVVFLLALGAVAAIVRIVVGAGAGAGV